MRVLLLSEITADYLLWVSASWAAKAIGIIWIQILRAVPNVPIERIDETHLKQDIFRFGDLGSL